MKAKQSSAGARHHHRGKVTSAHPGPWKPASKVMKVMAAWNAVTLQWFGMVPVLNVTPAARQVVVPDMPKIYFIFTEILQ